MGRKKKSKTYEKTNNEIPGIILITIGILMLISVFSTSSSGMVGRFAKRLFVALVGLGAYIIPFLIIFIGACFIAQKSKINFSRKFYGIVLFIVNTLLFVMMLNFKNYYVAGDAFSGVLKLYNGDSFIHGGIVSYLIDIPLYKLFDTAGCLVIFIAVYLISFIMICRISLYDISHKIKEMLTFNDSSDSEYDEMDNTEEITLLENAKEGNASSKASTGAEKDSFVKNLNSRIKIIDFMKSQDKSEDNSANNVQPSGNDKVSNDHNITDELEKEITENSNRKSIEYRFPPISLLNQNVQAKMNKEDKKELINNAAKLRETLNNFGVEANVLQVSKGPSVTRYEIQPSAGVKVSKIVNLSDDIALNLAAAGVRIEAPIPGKSAIGIEVPNSELTPVFLREVIDSTEFMNSNKNIAFSLGKDIEGKCVVSDLSKMPHLLIAGATGSGKSVCINTLIISMLYKYSPEDVKLLLIDPKVVELSIYNGIPHLLIPVVTDPKKAAGALNWAVNEMTKRYKMFAENSVRNIEGYNELFEKGKVENKLPFIVMIIDELADLMMVCPGDVEDYIGRLAQMARAAGMNLVIATQRPSVDVITGVIKANIPSRISFAVSSQIDSRTILDMAGAEKLLGKGDMLFYPVGEAKPIRIQGAFISETEVENVVNFIKDQEGEIEYASEIINQIDTSAQVSADDSDELLDEAIRIVIESEQASTSLVQRRLRIGYNRAARIIEQMEDRGIISGRDGSKPRQLLIDENDPMYGKYFENYN